MRLFLILICLIPSFLAGCATLQVSGRSHDLKLDKLLYIESGKASFYSEKFSGKVTANGETYNPNILTAAHPSLPFGSIVLVKRKSNGKFVFVRINDRGPFLKGRNLDLSKMAAKELGILSKGIVAVDVYMVTGFSPVSLLL